MCKVGSHVMGLSGKSLGVTFSLSCDDERESMLGDEGKASL